MLSIFGILKYLSLRYRAPDPDFWSKTGYVTIPVLGDCTRCWVSLPRPPTTCLCQDRISIISTLPLKRLDFSLFISLSTWYISTYIAKLIKANDYALRAGIRFKFRSWFWIERISSCSIYVLISRKHRYVKVKVRLRYN